MRNLENLIRRLNQLGDAGHDRREVYKAAEELWEYPSYESEITDYQLRDAYVLALFMVAGLFPSEKAIAPLKRAYSLDRGHFEFGVKGSAKEFAAYSLGDT
nr:hypothetical protein [Gemmatimonadaceae bacterium]